jgi:predicted membrane protein
MAAQETVEAVAAAVAVGVAVAVAAAAAVVAVGASVTKVVAVAGSVMKVVVAAAMRRARRPTRDRFLLMLDEWLHPSYLLHIRRHFR